MRLNLSSLVFSIRSSFWFLPTLLSISSIIAAFAIIEVDLHLQRGGYGGYLSPLSMPIESARLTLSTIAGSMITVATLIFSMTLVALTLVSQQLGPRILLRFMDDRPTQIVLGLFLATFLFALIILIRIGDKEIAGKVPGLTVVATAGLAIVSLGMMIHFIHHLATRIQADVLISELGNDLNSAAEKIATQNNKEGYFASDDERKTIRAYIDENSKLEISLPFSGYTLAFDHKAACAIASKNDFLLDMKIRPGEFILAGRPVFSVVTQSGDNNILNDLSDELCALLVVGPRRTPEASIEFEINALAEVALRALSPGINDPYTAMTCINRLADGVRILMARESDQRVSRDNNGDIRVVHVAEPFSRYLAKSFDSILEAAADNSVVLGKLASTIQALSSMSKNEDQIKDMKEYAKRIDCLMISNNLSRVNQKKVTNPS